MTFDRGGGWMDGSIEIELKLLVPGEAGGKARCSARCEMCVPAAANRHFRARCKSQKGGRPLMPHAESYRFVSLLFMHELQLQRS
jgi:hypothetical protein